MSPQFRSCLCTIRRYYNQFQGQGQILHIHKKNKSIYTFFFSKRISKYIYTYMAQHINQTPNNEQANMYILIETHVTHQQTYTYKDIHPNKFIHIYAQIYVYTSIQVHIQILWCACVPLCHTFSTPFLGCMYLSQPTLFRMFYDPLMTNPFTISKSNRFLPFYTRYNNHGTCFGLLHMHCSKGSFPGVCYRNYMCHISALNDFFEL